MEKGDKMIIPMDNQKYILWEMTLDGYGASFQGLELKPNDVIIYEGEIWSVGSDGMPEDNYSIIRDGKKHLGTISVK